MYKPNAKLTYIMYNKTFHPQQTTHGRLPLYMQLHADVYILSKLIYV